MQNILLAPSVAVKAWKSFFLLLTCCKLRKQRQVKLVVAGQNVVSHHLVIQVIFVPGGSSKWT